MVSIGDSFSYGVVPHSYHFTTVAERELPGIQFYNMGYPNIGPIDYHYLLVNEALPLAPDLVVVQLFVGNDVTSGPSVAGPRRWYDADSYLAAIVWYRLGIMRRAKRVDVAAAAERPLQSREALAARYPWLADPAQEPPGMRKEVFLQLELQNALGVSAAAEGVYQRFFQMLSFLKSAAGNVPLAFVVIPDEFQVEDDLWQEVDSLSSQPLDRDRPQREVVAWLTARGWPVLDLLPLLRAVEPLPDGRRHVYHLQDTHFNARGNEVAGRALARFVDSLRSAPPAPPPPPAPPRPPLALPLHLDPGDSTARQWMVSGWHPAEAAGGRRYAWSDSVESVLRLPLPRGGDLRMDLEVLPYEFSRSPTQRVTIVLNGTGITVLTLRPGVQKYSVVLPAGSLNVPESVLEFRYAWTRTPQEVAGSADTRRLAVAWYSIDFAAVER